MINLIHSSWIEGLWHIDADLDFEIKKMNMEQLLSPKQMCSTSWKRPLYVNIYHISYSMLIVLTDMA